MLADSIPENRAEEPGDPGKFRDDLASNEGDDPGDVSGVSSWLAAGCQLGGEGAGGGGRDGLALARGLGVSRDEQVPGGRAPRHSGSGQLATGGAGN